MRRMFFHKYFFDSRNCCSEKSGLEVSTLLIRGRSRTTDFERGTTNIWYIYDKKFLTCASLSGLREARPFNDLRGESASEYRLEDPVERRCNIIATFNYFDFYIWRGFPLCHVAFPSDDARITSIISMGVDVEETTNASLGMNAFDKKNSPAHPPRFLVPVLFCTCRE